MIQKCCRKIRVHKRVVFKAFCLGHRRFGRVKADKWIFVQTFLKAFVWFLLRVSVTTASSCKCFIEHQQGHTFRSIFPQSPYSFEQPSHQERNLLLPTTEAFRYQFLRNFRCWTWKSCHEPGCFFKDGSRQASFASTQHGSWLHRTRPAALKRWNVFITRGVIWQTTSTRGVKRQSTFLNDTSECKLSNWRRQHHNSKLKRLMNSDYNFSRRPWELEQLELLSGFIKQLKNNSFSCGEPQIRVG